ncbi:uncharacterized protein LOC128920282 isoform X1 [Zeugodacus cucurbitae]|nr:uncharacterized protein LOC128920217 [Zeugodacus cucurbitae]XP_054083309.1 uncharacterized protein LOC128920282 isoform X1 [Zeugodacus cucurbitae]
MKSKMRYLKALYVAAAAWKNKTGSGLLANGDESSVSAHVNKICPNFDLLEVIFGQRKNVNPGVIFESTDSIEVLADSPCADSSLNDTIDSYDLCALDCEDLVDPILPISISSDCSAAAAATSTPQSSLDFRSSTKKPKRKSEAPFNKLIFIQEKRLELEVKKIELEKEKEKNEVELKRIELNNQLEMKRIETESEKETKLEIEKLKLASEERIKMFEIELKLKSK